MLQVFRTIIVACWLYEIYQQFCKTEFVSELFPFSKPLLRQALLIPIFYLIQKDWLQQLSDIQLREQGLCIKGSWLYNLGWCTCSGFRTLFPLLSWLSVLGRKVLCLHCWLKTPCVAVNSEGEISLNETPTCHSWALSIPETTRYSWPGQNLHGRHNQRKNWSVFSASLCG